MVTEKLYKKQIIKIYKLFVCLKSLNMFDTSSVQCPDIV